MAKAKQLTIKESVSYLKSLLKKSKPIFYPRIRMLIELKKHEQSGLSKIALASAVGVNPNSIQTWRKTYEQKGLQGLLTHRKKGFKPSVISNQEHQNLAEILKNATNNLHGYKELKHWFEKKHGRKIAYTTLVGYCIRHFKTKIKVARKSHVKKDEEKLIAFKKTLVSTYQEC